MNFFCDSRGTIFHVDPEPIYQNSAGANELYFIGAFSSSAQVTVSYKLPNGLYTEPKLMTSVTDSTLDITDQYGKGFSVWKEVIGQSVMTDGAGNIVYGQDYTVTENYGKVDVQFVVYANGQGASRLGTASGSFDVGKGVPIVLPDGVENDILAQILVSLQTILQDIAKNTADISKNKSDIIITTTAAQRLWNDVTVLKEDTQTNAKNIQSTAQAVVKNINNIALLSDVQYQAGLQYIQPIEDAYNERITANGENVLDWQGNGSTARLLKVVGNTQATRNLINPALTTGYVTYAVDGNSIVLTNTKGSPSSFYLYSVKRTKGTYTLSVKDIAGESSRRFLTIYKDGVNQQTITTFPTVVTITLDEDAEISLRGEVGIGDYNTTTISELQLVEGVYTEDTMPEYTPYFDGLKSASFQGIVSKNADGTKKRVLSFPALIECGLGVTIDFEKQVIINNGTETPFTDEQKAVGNEYTAWKGGEERVQGNDNATYDINPTMTQEYVVITSVKEDTV